MSLPSVSGSILAQQSPNPVRGEARSNSGCGDCTCWRGGCSHNRGHSKGQSVLGALLPTFARISDRRAEGDEMQVADTSCEDLLC